MNGFAHAVRVIGVHDQRFGKLPRGAGEARKDQHAFLVVARRHEFLGHQIHAVVQARNHAEVRGAKKFVDLAAARDDG